MKQLVMPQLRPSPRTSAGFTLLEVLVAASLLLIVFFGLAEIYSRGRRQLGYEEDRRKATAVAQARMDGLRRDYRYDDLLALNGTDTTLVVDGKDYVVSQFMKPDSLDTEMIQATVCSLAVTWTAKVDGADVPRTESVRSIIGRELPWAD